jgi:hypothetical protein
MALSRALTGPNGKYDVQTHHAETVRKLSGSVEVLEELMRSGWLERTP